MYCPTLFPLTRHLKYPTWCTSPEVNQCVVQTVQSAEDQQASHREGGGGGRRGREEEEEEEGEGGGGGVRTNAFFSAFQAAEIVALCC